MIKMLSKFLVNWLSYEKPAQEFPLCDFDKIRFELKPGDVILIEGRSRVSEVIKQITQSPWSHAALYIGRIHEIEDPALRQKLRQNIDCADHTQLVVESYVGRGTFASPLEGYRNDHIRICRPNGLSRPDAAQVVAFAVEKLGTPYAVRQVLDLARFILPWNILPRRWRSSLFEHHAGEQTRTICSVMIAEAFASIDFPILPVVKSHHEKGIELIVRNPRLFTPRDFDYSPYFEIIKYPYISFVDSPYRHLPWNRDGLISPDGQAIYDPNNPPAPKPKHRFRLRKKHIPATDSYGTAQPMRNDIDAMPDTLSDPLLESQQDHSNEPIDLTEPEKGYKKYKLFGRISIRFPSVNE